MGNNNSFGKEIYNIKKRSELDMMDLTYNSDRVQDYHLKI